MCSKHTTQTQHDVFAFPLPQGVNDGADIHTDNTSNPSYALITDKLLFVLMLHSQTLLYTIRCLFPWQQLGGKTNITHSIYTYRTGINRY